MSDVIRFPERHEDATLPSSNRPGPVPQAPPWPLTSPDISAETNLLKIKEIEEDIFSLVDEFVVTSECTTVVSSESVDSLPAREMTDLESLSEIIVFSPEIQQDGFSKEAQIPEGGVPAVWGDVFIKVGEEYPFLFTLYTRSYVRSQFLRYGERILPSPKDIILERKTLRREDIVRAVIKWTNLYCHPLMGRPIELERDSVLQTLVCDPFVEVRCPEP